MLRDTEVRGVVIVMEKQVASALTTVSLKRNWPVLTCPTIREALRKVLRGASQIVIVQVSKQTQQALELIRTFRSVRNEVPAIAVALIHDELLERAVRQTGATCYLPDGCSAEALDSAITACSPAQQVETDDLQPCDWHPGPAPEGVAQTI